MSGLLLTGVLPAGARRAAALALGVTLGTAPAVALVTGPPAPALVTAAAADELGPATDAALAVDWPGVPSAGVVPDWPSAPDPAGAPADAHVVLRGDCLWDIAADRLQRDRPGTSPTDAEVARAVQAWWQANADVIGPDPDLLLPGQVLRPPA
jgi:nucleoid-associated protein YgaU